MSNRSQRLGALVAAALATAALPASAAARPQGPRAAAVRASTTIHVVEHAVTDTVVHSGGSGDKTGNLLTFHNRIFNASDRRQVGRDEGFCVRISPTQGSWECLWTTFLARGQITVQGPYYDTRNSVLSITGGTGAYRDARGEMVLKSRDGGKEYDFIFHLDR